MASKCAATIYKAPRVIWIYILYSLSFIWTTSYKCLQGKAIYLITFIEEVWVVFTLLESRVRRELEAQSKWVRDLYKQESEKRSSSKHCGVEANNMQRCDAKVGHVDIQ